MTLHITDDGTTILVARLAAAKGLSEQDAVKLAVAAELARLDEAIPLRERLAQWRRAHPLPPPTGKAADKAFFDDLSGES